ncbi:hypothetical protein ACFYP8_23600 [Streptomyces hirsutus]|uniref:hypothetical protein n=1 Tax=Streptomyces hirsutus TaxID=35620 RepID=UPI00368A7D61
MSQHDLLRLLESLRSADGLELVREVAERLLQELIEAEATTKIATAVLAELHDEWIAFPRRYLSNESMDALYTDTPTVLPATSDD